MFCMLPEGCEKGMIRQDRDKTRLGVSVTQVCSLLKITISLTKISLPGKTLFFFFFLPLGT